MVSETSVTAQLKRIDFSLHAWGRAEVGELPAILLADEQIFECVNGIYEGGFALLVATDIRVLLVDKKPFNFLTVEDLRFDMINEIDYNHRLFGAYVNISTGNRDLKFRSYNQPRLRKLISHVQHCMAESKKKETSHQEDQNQHLEQINERLQAYLMAQHQHQEELQQQLHEARQKGIPVANSEAPRPSPELSDYLLAQGLLAQHQQSQPPQAPPPAVATVPASNPALPQVGASAGAPQNDLYAEGVREVFGKRAPAAGSSTIDRSLSGLKQSVATLNPIEINALRIAYSKLPMALRNRRFGRPSLHAHSQDKKAEPTVQPQLT